MSLSDFWTLTPADVDLAIQGWERRERSAYWRAGLVTSAIINANRKPGTRAAKPDDFVPRPRVSAPQSWERMAAILKEATLAMGGTVTVGRGD